MPGVTSVNEIPATKGIKISPNPFSDKFTIEIPADMNEGEISVSNSIGQEILKQPLTERISVLDLGKFPSGIYFVKLFHNMEVEVHKIIRK